jgi:hypothetical protein
MTARRTFVLVAIVSVPVGVAFAATGQHREVAIPWLLAGLAAGVLLVDRRGRP